jgi:hypothetical protein
MNVLEKILEEIENLNYYPEGMGCGIEDRCITDRYEACEYGWYEAIEAVIEVIQNMEDGKTDNDWIPVSEKLPEENDGKYYPMLNVSTSYGAVKWGFYRVRDKEWYIYSEMHGELIKAEDKEVIAWQPLPEPYKEE